MESHKYHLYCLHSYQQSCAPARILPSSVYRILGFSSQHQLFKLVLQTLTNTSKPCDQYSHINDSTSLIPIFCGHNDHGMCFTDWHLQSHSVLEDVSKTTGSREQVNLLGSLSSFFLGSSFLTSRYSYFETHWT